MKIMWGILTISCLLAFSTSTGTYFPQKDIRHKDGLYKNTSMADTITLMNIIQPIADSFATEAVKRLDSVATRTIFFVKRVDMERNATTSPRLWITIYKKQNGISQYDTTIVIKIPYQ